MRAGAPPAAPTLEEGAAAAETAAPETAQTPQSILELDEMRDLYWTLPPTDKVWVIISRRERKRKAKTRMPRILRDLAPDSVFDPRKAWANVKEARVESRAAAEAEEKSTKAADAKAKIGKKEKVKKLTKADEIRVKNDEAQRAKEVGASCSVLALLLDDCVSYSARLPWGCRLGRWPATWKSWTTPLRPRRKGRWRRCVR
jgi:hypothetical protein